MSDADVTDVGRDSPAAGRRRRSSGGRPGVAEDAKDARSKSCCAVTRSPPARGRNGQRIARKLGALTVGVVTRPFSFERKRRSNQPRSIAALRGELHPHRDSQRPVAADDAVSLMDASVAPTRKLLNGVQGITDPHHPSLPTSALPTSSGHHVRCRQSHGSARPGRRPVAVRRDRHQLAVAGSPMGGRRAGCPTPAAATWACSDQRGTVGAKTPLTPITSSSAPSSTHTCSGDEVWGIVIAAVVAVPPRLWVDRRRPPDASRRLAGKLTSDPA